MAAKESETFPVSPGSFNDFEQSHPSVSRSELHSLYSDELALFAGRLAEYYGISPEDLHAMRFPHNDLSEVA